MKQKVSITLDKETLKLIEESLKTKAFRNRSHVVEFSVNEILNNSEKGVEEE